MIDRTSLLLLKRAICCYFFTENIVLDNIIQNLLNLGMDYQRRFLHLSLLLISIYTVHLFGRLVKKKLQEEVEGLAFGWHQHSEVSLLFQKNGMER